jgi:hypothetical protein
MVYACGGAPDTPLLDGGNGNPEGGLVDQVNGDGSGTCDISACVSVPSGFDPVTLSASNCPSGWSQTDVGSAPMAGDGTCTCSCNVTAPPSCDSGAIHRYLDTSSSAMCGTPATTLYAPASCTQLNNPIVLSGFHYQVDSVPPMGGTCQYDAVVDKGKITTTRAHVCAPPASCQGAVCGSNVCVQKAGDVACPSGFPQKTLVGTSANAMCSDCGTACTASGMCTGTLALFTDQFCTSGKAAFPADGTCNNSTGTLNGYYYSYSFAGMLSGPASCEGTPPKSTATVSLDSPTTVCCQH